MLDEKDTLALLRRAKAGDASAKEELLSHNTSLLRDLDPHNVFLVDIDADGDRGIRSISSLKRTRDTNNNQARYLRGDMGAVPHIGSVDMANIVQHLREDLR